MIPQHTCQAIKDTAYSLCYMKNIMSTVLFVTPKALLICNVTHNKNTLREPPAPGFTQKYVAARSILQEHFLFSVAMKRGYCEVAEEFTGTTSAQIG